MSQLMDSLLDPVRLAQCRAAEMRELRRVPHTWVQVPMRERRAPPAEHQPRDWPRIAEEAMR